MLENIYLAKEYRHQEIEEKSEKIKQIKKWQTKILNVNDYIKSKCVKHPNQKRG
jgi:hypothetical protein